MSRPETPSGTGALIDDVAVMIVEAIPGIALLGPNMAILHASRDTQDPRSIRLIARPIDFADDLVRIGLTLTIESIAREPQQAIAITASHAER